MTTEGQQQRLDPALRGRLIASFKFRDDGLVDISQTLDALIETIAPAAQPLPTMTEIEQVWENDSATRACNQNTKYVFSRALRCAGLVAREDEPEPGEVDWIPSDYDVLQMTRFDDSPDTWASVLTFIHNNPDIAGLAKAVIEGDGS